MKQDYEGSGARVPTNKFSQNCRPFFFDFVNREKNSHCRKNKNKFVIQFRKK